MSAIVAQRRAVATDVVEVTLRSADGRPLSAWSPGAHIDLDLGPGLVRSYSLCGKPGDVEHYRIAVLREPDSRGGSEAVHQKLHIGSTVPITGPRNNFALDPAPSYLFIAGGIGITPLLPMIEHAEVVGARWRLLYGGRRRLSMAYVAELEEFGRNVVIRPEEQHGLLKLADAISANATDELIYCCGPERLLQAVEDHCAVVGRSHSLRVERFKPKPTQSETAKSEFLIELGGSGEVLAVPADRTILDVLRDAGIDVLSSCEEGTCGSCEQNVLAGVPDHRDSVLTAEEQASGDRMMVCVSRCLSPTLHLDIEPEPGSTYASPSSRHP